MSPDPRPVPDPAAVDPAGEPGDREVCADSYAVEADVFADEPAVEPEAGAEAGGAAAGGAEAGGAAPARRGRGAFGFALAAIAVLTISFALRPGASSVGPLLDPISEAFGRGETYGGLLTAMPGLCFGVIGLLAVPVAKRLGLTGSIVVAIGIAALGLALRPLSGGGAVFALLTVLALAGPALGNVLVPAWVKRHGGSRTVALMTMYSIVLAAGGTAGTLFSVPIAEAAPDGWRTALGVWSLGAAVPALVWLLVLRRTGHDFQPPAGGGRAPGSLLRSPMAIALTITFGLQSMHAYIQMGWTPSILADAGLAPATAGALASVSFACGMLGGLVMPMVIARVRNLQPIMLAMGVLTASGYAGLLLAPGTAPLLWMLLLGIGGFVFPATIALLPARTRDARVTARLSGMVQPVGYMLAAIGPFAVGLAHEALAGWTAILVVLLVLSLVMGAVAWKASAARMVDDELAPAA
ncbi:MFS transporter [Brachybacterium phenoliresistens]|uniref:MFS transporter n=1 Tax=Brachybacterium phenoliresistens TaxID=396014 RepID=UPI0031DAFF25